MSTPRQRWQALVAPVLAGERKAPGGKCSDCGGLAIGRDEIQGPAMPKKRCWQCATRHEKARRQGENPRRRA